MAVTVDQGNVLTRAQAAVAASTQNTSVAIAVNGMISVLTFTFTTGGATASHTMSGGGLTWVRDHTVTSGNIRLSLHHAFAPAGLTLGTTLTNTAAAASDHTWIAASYLGIDSTGSPVRAFNGGSTSAAAWASGTLTGAQAGDLIVGGSGSDGFPALTNTPGGDSFERIEFTSATTAGNTVLLDDLDGEADDTVAGTWSTAQFNLSIGAAYIPVSTPSTPPNPMHAPAGMFDPDLNSQAWF